jgi:hypothetical protein
VIYIALILLVWLDQGGYNWLDMYFMCEEQKYIHFFVLKMNLNFLSLKMGRKNLVLCLYKYDNK